MNIFITRRNFIKGVGLLTASAALAACGCQSNTAANASSSSASSTTGASPLLAIIHTNDSHGHDVEVKGTDKTQGNFSMAAVAQLKADWEAKGYDVLLVDAGDATQGMPLVDQSKGEAAITFMNACGYQAMAVGNHEFDHGDDVIRKYEEEANFPLLSANVLVKETGEQRFASSTTFDLSDGTKVGFFGLTTPSTETSALPSFTEQFTFLQSDELYACAQKQVDELRARGCDIVVCLGHLGNATACEPNTSRSVLANVKGIDLFIDGHDHELVSEDVDGTPLVETGCYLSNIGLMVIDSGAPVNQSVAYGSYDGIDPSVQSVIDQIDQQVQSELKVVLGHTSYHLDGEKNTARTQETNLGDFCCDSLLWDAEQSLGTPVDCCIVNGGSLRSSIEEGDISLASIKSVLSFSNQIQVGKVTGAQLLEVLEAGCQNIGLENSIGAFPQVGGIEYTIDASVPYEKGENYPDSTFASPAKPGSRVTINSVGGRSWNAEDAYTIASYDFIFLGGDTYYVLKQAAETETPTTCDFDYEAFAGYLTVACDHEVPDRYENPQGRITIVGL